MECALCFVSAHFQCWTSAAQVPDVGVHALCRQKSLDLSEGELLLLYIMALGGLHTSEQHAPACFLAQMHLHQAAVLYWC